MEAANGQDGDTVRENAVETAVSHLFRALGPNQFQNIRSGGVAGPFIPWSEFQILKYQSSSNTSKLVLKHIQTISAGGSQGPSIPLVT